MLAWYRHLIRGAFVPAGLHRSVPYHHLETSDFESYAMGSRDSLSEAEDEKKAVGVEAVQVHVALATKEVDTGAQLVAGEDIELDEAEALRIRRKIDWHIMPLMCSEYLTTYDLEIMHLEKMANVNFQYYIGYNTWTRQH